MKTEWVPTTDRRNFTEAKRRIDEFIFWLLKSAVDAFIQVGLTRNE
ncbi:hypothetical protein [Aliiglaciecola sp. M165]|nr:hypothetical protein [Aliiglaciecola sp. M165]